MASSLQNEVHLPLIDISQFQLELERGEPNELQNHCSVTSVKEACKERGMFRLVNHAIPQNLLQHVESVSHQLFSMPPEAKERAAACKAKNGYTKFPTNEVLVFNDLPNSNSIPEVCKKIWSLPDEETAAICRETIETFATAILDLAQTTNKIILASLGLDVDTFYRSDFKKNTGNLAINHYSCEGRICSEEAALPPHTDLCCFTILYQANQEGLQIRSKEGKWLNVKPLSDSFVVFIGDCLKVWTNGIYHSADHRVVYSGWKDRISIALFINFLEQKEIWAPAHLVDDEDHKRLYRPFTLSQLLEEFVKSWGSTEPRSMFIDRFAGI
ncbi:hypothetical protein SUGI_0851890 [Cryptomeria japonica]|uniref:probable 2-oxoglutarate-dependent dioxygenase AOP1 n=1 Tax=Cryptomeria japonica TaxID=3369 RepID=UPI002414B241|nr:probable 2-oxoglutarate-dependent dioxygenase AOP1 [Cryptomeria japonica]GLJ41122.1 hypothetical protein SUGI_0851890 [Cryptomeria japonica]